MDKKIRAYYVRRGYKASWLAFLAGCTIIFIGIVNGTVGSYIREWQDREELDQKSAVAQAIIKNRRTATKDCFPTCYYFTCQFNALPANGSVQRIEQEKEVGRDIYNQFSKISAVNVQYLPEKPNVWKVQGDTYNPVIKKVFAWGFFTLLLVIGGMAGILIFHG